MTNLPQLRSLSRFFLILAVGAAAGGSRPAEAGVKAHRGEIVLPTYSWAAVKHPYFRGTDNLNIYPYPMLDFLSRERTNRAYRTVVLENEWLRLTFLPELGGKVYEVLDHATGQPMFYVNHVVKPALIAQCGAWTSGGIEWNTGPQGHTVSAMQPVHVEILPPEADGSRSVVVGETERIYGTRWTVVVTLRPGRSFIEERIRIYNPSDTVRPYYFWNCTAVPNPPGFRFIYPMTLGTDHACEKFFQWPVDHGKDLSRGANYQDASSIFAWHCDQDFFGSYDEGADRGVVACANHYEVPGKKAWTWGHGSFGRMYERDLTDTDGPYNEVQTGPLLTQSEVGRLDPCEAVEWREWWYPVHGLGGFTFANRDLAASVSVVGDGMSLRLLGSGTWKKVEARVLKDNALIASDQCGISPRTPSALSLGLVGAAGPFEVEILANGNALARFRMPLDLPVRHPPEKPPKPESASALAQAGWEDYLLARFPVARTNFMAALTRDAESISARSGLAYLALDSDPLVASADARKALAVAPGCGAARYALAAAERRLGEPAALDDAWLASLDPAVAAAGRALAAKILIREERWEAAVEALSGSGPWQTDPLCRNRLALALLRFGDKAGSIRLARANLETDPLDGFARSILWLVGSETKSISLGSLITGQRDPVLDLVAEYSGLGQADIAARILDQFYLEAGGREPADPIALYWRGWLAAQPGAATNSNAASTATFCKKARNLPAMGVSVSRIETLPVLRAALEADPSDPQAALYLGDLLFHLGRYAEARVLWEQAVEKGASPVLPCRSLGQAARNLDHDLSTGRRWLERANQADPGDAIVARDLGRVLLELADKAPSDAEKRQLFIETCERLDKAFTAGNGRSDFVALLARAQNRSGNYAASARMLDAARVTVWEGSHEVHDLFEQAHIGLGEAQLAAGHPGAALAEFNRALEYPDNLATGKREDAREAHIQYLRGNALDALGQNKEALAAWKLAANEPESKDEKIEAARKKAQAALARSAVVQ
jgi:tetratricopeptide (TPR) repeat protein